MFCSIDAYQKGYIIAQDIENFIKNWYEVKNRTGKPGLTFDYWKFMGKITFDKFQTLILPEKNEDLKNTILSRNPTLIVPIEPLDSEIITILIQFFIKQDELDNALNVLRRKIFKLKVAPFSLFETIDFENTHFIDGKNLRKFLVEMGEEVNLNDAVISIKRFSSNKDAKLSYIEFLGAILPFENEKKNENPISYNKVLRTPSKSIHGSMIKSESIYISSEYRKKRTFDDRIFFHSYIEANSEIFDRSNSEDKKLEIHSKNLFRSEDELIKLFKLQVKAEREIEERKQELWSKSDFSILGMFHFLGANPENGLRKNNLIDSDIFKNFEPQMLEILYKRYAKDPEALTLAEVEKMMAPIRMPEVDFDEIYNVLSLETSNLLIQVLLTLIKYNSEIEFVKESLLNISINSFLENQADLEGYISIEHVFYINA